MKKQLKENNNNKKFIIWFLLFIAIFSLGLVKKSFQNDTFYTIKIGELILNNGIDMMDHFSFHQNLAYTYPHWLYDCFIYITYYLGGYFGIYLSTIILFIILISIIFKTNIKLTSNLTVSALATLICTLAIGSFATARAQLVSFLFFTLEIYFIESYYQTGKKKNLLGLLLVSLIICNIHVAVWPFYFIVYLPYIAEYIIAVIINLIKQKKDPDLINKIEDKIIIEKNSHLKALVIIMILSLLTGLITPIQDTPYTYLIKTMMGNSQDYIQEHQMMTWLDSPFTIIIAFEMIFLTIISKVKLRDLFMVCGLVIMSISSIRHLSLLALIGTICFSRTFTIFFTNYNLPSDETLIKFFLKKSTTIISFTAVSIFAIITLTLQNKSDYIEKDKYPIEAVKYIKENLNINEIKLYNEYNFGSYLILENIPVFIDSRADLYTKQFSKFEYDILDDYYYMENIYQQKFEDYHITHALVYKKDLKNKVENILYKKLKEDTNYEQLYEDEYFVLYEKKGTPDFVVTYK